ncbi:uncharacterized protein LOC129003879 [Macrosteles quadrilineatus]|uniref:uncharacterized protein LOC129003879 n=1 Tax=Macrosteles quadrilineatus TaxID=74068 RepID=UPI0023E25004|nr:uncharacterized protein LOC129003879 [Macrosteles quadrilineatus]
MYRRDIRDKHIEETNAALNYMCNELKLNFIDTSLACQEDCYGPDNIHPNRKGATILSNIIIEKAKLLFTNPPQPSMETDPTTHPSHKPTSEHPCPQHQNNVPQPTEETQEDSTDQQIPINSQSTTINTKIDTKPHCEELASELVAIHLPEQQLTVIGAYRSPSKPIEELTKHLDPFLEIGSEEDKKIYSNFKRAYDLDVKKKKSEHTMSIINNAPNRNKTVWNIINKESNTDNKVNNITLNSNGRQITDPTSICNTFNNYFINIGNHALQNPNLNKASDPTQPDMTQKPHLSAFKTITQHELNKLFKILPPKSSCGLDEIPNKILKYCKNELIPPLTNIINTSIIQATVPQAMKQALVYPKFKKGDTTLTENYRPISILPALSKYLEKIINSQIITFLENNHLLSDNQHGFREKKSINTALAQLCNTITNIWEDKKTANGIFLDLQKAFDSLDHNLLLQKISALNINNKALDWIKSYLHNRQELIEIEHQSGNFITKSRSKLQTITQGIPQGSVLGPLLFLIYIDTFPTLLPADNTCIMFADDTTIIVPGTPTPNLTEKTIDTAKKNLQ